MDEDWNVTKAVVPRATNGQVFPWNNVRLPSFVRPTRYNITIHPNLTTLEVKGQVSIEFHVEKDTQFIVLHSKNLTITDKVRHKVSIAFYKYFRVSILLLSSSEYEDMCPATTRVGHPMLSLD